MVGDINSLQVQPFSRLREGVICQAISGLPAESFDHSARFGWTHIRDIFGRKIRPCCYPYSHAVFPPLPACQTLWRLMVVSLEELNELLMKQDCREKLLDVSSLLTKMLLTRLLLVR
jgi:hypothetical protein